MEENLSPTPLWDVDKTHPQYHDDLIENLAGITDPELGYSIIELGLVRNISIENDTARVVMILTTPFCPYGPNMLESTRAKVEQVLGLKTELEYGQETWTPAFMEKDLMDDDWGLLP
ncbi:MAG TPA: iron-sulfur cluster assembly protein [Anaerolineaceae bacterium]|mgnify:CR=1 FL=1|nr:iron-sulfur cluster assembly protein [Anaerolineaceae bacterium]HPS32155.1 iron-sulfur cluster assembly protein [Anaerolineaceae bacterium]